MIDVVRGIPAEMVQWWKDGHRWDRDKYDYEYEYDSYGQPITQIRYESDDYVLWRRLGVLSDALLLVIVLLIVFMVVL